MSEFKSLSSDEMERLFSSDPGIDFENYSFDEIKEQYKGCHPRGYYGVLVRLHNEPDKKKINSIELPDDYIAKTKVHNKFTRQVGLVVKFGPGVYKDEERYKYTGKICNEGEWIVFSRTDARPFAYKKMATLWLPEDVPFVVVDDPRDVETL